MESMVWLLMLAQMKGGYSCSSNAIPKPPGCTKTDLDSFLMDQATGLREKKYEIATLFKILVKILAPSTDASMADQV